MLLTEIKKMVDEALIKGFQGLVEDVRGTGYVRPEAYLDLKKTYNEILSRKTIHLNTEALADVLPILKGDSPVSANAAAMPVEGLGETALRVIDKMSDGIQGLTRYTLGYALDKTKPFTGDNVIKCADLVWYTLPLRTDETVSVLYKSAAPVMINGKIGVEFQGLVIKGDIRKRPECAKEIIKTAYSGKRLDVSRDMLVEIQKARLLEVDVDSQFGIEMAKTLPIKKVMRAMSKGVFYCVVYEPNAVDTDGDYTTEEDIEDACWLYMEKYQKLNLFHDESLSDKECVVVENALALCDIPIGEDVIKKGSWYIAVKVKDPLLKEAIESGELNSLSMQGTAAKGEPIPELEAQKG